MTRSSVTLLALNALVVSTLAGPAVAESDPPSIVRIGAQRTESSQRAAEARRGGSAPRQVARPAGTTARPKTSFPSGKVFTLADLQALRASRGSGFSTVSGGGGGAIRTARTPARTSTQPATPGNEAAAANQPNANWYAPTNLDPNDGEVAYFRQELTDSKAELEKLRREQLAASNPYLRSLAGRDGPRTRDEIKAAMAEAQARQAAAQKELTALSSRR
ncbi:MAG: hypothetical protein AAF533_26400 [Acidobacteriota bacterium]